MTRFRGFLLVVAVGCSSAPAKKVELDGMIPPPPPTIPDAAPVPVPTGEIDGQITVVSTLSVSAAPSCSRAVPPRLSIGPSGGVAGVVVWLELAPGRTVPPPAADFPVAEAGLDRCGFDPQVILFPAGSKSIALRNDDTMRHDLTVEFATGERIGPLFMPLEGQRFLLPVPGRTAGIFQLGCADHPDEHGWGVIAAHRFYTLADSDGRYHFGDVPAGKLTVHAWHPPIAERGPALQAESSVELPARQGAQLTANLELR